MPTCTVHEIPQETHGWPPANLWVSWISCHVLCAFFWKDLCCKQSLKGLKRALWNKATTASQPKCLLYGLTWAFCFMYFPPCRCPLPSLSPFPSADHTTPMSPASSPFLLSSPFILYPLPLLCVTSLKKNALGARHIDWYTNLKAFLKSSLPSSQGNSLPGSAGTEQVSLAWLYPLPCWYSDTFQSNDGFLTSLSVLSPPPPHQK